MEEKKKVLLIIKKKERKRTMKEFFKIMAKDILSEKFTAKEYVVYGVLAPVALVLIMGLAGWMETIFQ